MLGGGLAGGLYDEERSRLNDKMHVMSSFIFLSFLCVSPPPPLIHMLEDWENILVIICKGGGGGGGIWHQPDVFIFFFVLI